MGAIGASDTHRISKSRECPIYSRDFVCYRVNVKIRIKLWRKMMSTNKNSQAKVSYKAIGLALGLVFGGFVGLLIGSPIIFAGGGLVLGLALGSALDAG